MINGDYAFALILGVLASSSCAETIQVCANKTEMPPFSYAERIDGHKTEQVVGASVDLLKQIGQTRGWTIQVQLLPWARCLALVASNRIRMAIDIDKTDAKANDLLVSEPYFTLHNVYYYSRKARPQGLTLNALADVQHYKLCGFGGYRFEMFGVETSSVDRGTTEGYEQLITKLHLGRCDLFIDSRETMAGQYLINPKLRTMLVNGTLISQPLPGLPTRDLHFAVSAKGPNSASFLKAVNEGLEDLAKTKVMDQLLTRYLE
jgi:polar amino acid transport system substrate-binding protein